MNGSNHLEESDQQPLHACPVCLRKLESALRFDIRDRYEQLRTFSEKAGWVADADWFQRQLDRVPK